MTCMTVMLLKDLLLTTLLLINCVALSSTQSCGTDYCSQEYNDTCSQDETCLLYDNCMTSQSGCNETMGAPSSLSVDCYDTCITGLFSDPTIPLKCCGDSISSTNTISNTTGQNYLIARLYSLNENGVYRHNTFCKYNVECPNDDYDLYYTMVRFNVEAPDANDTCLDFLRYHFTATGASVETDACGNLTDLPSVLQGGAHGSALTVDFRSNRIKRVGDFFLAVTCVNIGGARKKRDTTSHVDTSLVDPLVLAKEPLVPKQTEASLDPGSTNLEVKPPAQSDCTPSMSLERQVVRDPNIEISDEEYLDAVFPKEKLTNEVVTVTRTGAVEYRDNTIFVKLQEGKIPYRVKEIKVLQVYNRIEGHLTFRGSASPPEKPRDFPGYGFLRIGRGFAQYYQTLIEPKYLLNDKEQTIVRELHQELFNRQTLDKERLAYSTSKHLTAEYAEKVDCRINELAELNSQSCTDVVRAAANFYLEKDTFQEFCRSDR